MNDAVFLHDRLASSGTQRALNLDTEAGSSVLPLLLQYLRIVRRWRFLIAGSITICLLLGFLANILATRQYTATSRIEIDREASRVLNVGEVQPGTPAIDIEFYQTQYGLLKSYSLAERVVRRLGLADDPAFFEIAAGRGSYQSIARGVSSPQAAHDRRARTAASILLGKVDIAPVRGSSLVDIHWTSPQPALSARIANAWAASFIEGNLERRFDASSYARRFLEERLAQLRQRLEESERQLVAYASAQAIINVPVPGADASGRPQERSLTADSLAAMNAEFASATADRLRAESRLRELSGGATSEAVANPAVATLRQRRAEVAADYSRMLAQFQPGYPPAQQLKAQLDQLDKSISEEEQRIQRMIRNTYDDSVRREEEVSRAVNKLKSSFLDQRRRSIQYNIYQREADTNRQLYEGLLQRYKEIGVAGGIGTNNVAIVDAAQVPDLPSRPRPFVNLMMALLVGVVIGLVLALVREQIDETVADPSDLEGRLGLPLLGTIPQTSSGDDPRSELKNPKSALLEAYLSTQISLGFSTDHGTPYSLSVTSTRPSEGKSTTAYAFAYLLARNGARTLLIDSDMRSPSVHTWFEIRNVRGLSDYLAGTDDWRALVQRPEEELFDVLVAGPRPPNAADLLRGNRLDMLLRELTGKYDHVVIDSPPVLGLADAPIVASKVEGTIYVVEAHGVRARIARQAIARLRASRARLLGTVLTKFNVKRAHYGYGYEYGYGYGQGENKKK